MQSPTWTALHTQTHRPKCDDIMPSLPQLSPCCSPTMDWWTSSRPSSPPPPPLLHQSVLLLPCSAIAIYSCPPLSPCNTFTLHRYPVTLRFVFVTQYRVKKEQIVYELKNRHLFLSFVCFWCASKLFTLDYTFPTHCSVEHRLRIILTCNMMFGPKLVFHCLATCSHSYSFSII